MDDTDLGNGIHQGWQHDQRMRTVETVAYPGGDYNWALQQMDVQFAYNPDSTVNGVSDEMGGDAQYYSYSFDPLNRMSGWTNGAGLSCTFGVDRYGNLADSSGNASCGLLTGKSFNASNQVVGYVYDGAGEVVSDTAGTSYAWNVEGQLSGYQQTGQPAMSYLYDGLGRRVEKLSNGAVVATYFYNALGNLVSELDGTSFTDYIYSPSDGMRIASVVGASGVSPVYYYHTDALGTLRAMTDENGNNVASCGQNANYRNGSFLDYAPFGASLDCDQPVTQYKFTGKYRDPESGLDDFGARYYSSQLGRFLTPDWSAAPQPIPLR